MKVQSGWYFSNGSENHREANRHHALLLCMGLGILQGYSVNFRVVRFMTSVIMLLFPLLQVLGLGDVDVPTFEVLL